MKKIFYVEIKIPAVNGAITKEFEDEESARDYAKVVHDQGEDLIIGAQSIGIYPDPEDINIYVIGRINYRWHEHDYCVVCNREED